MTRINKSKDGIIGPKPLSTEAEDARLQALADEHAVKTTKPKAKKKAKKKFQPVMKAKKTRK